MSKSQSNQKIGLILKQNILGNNNIMMNNQSMTQPNSVTPNIFQDNSENNVINKIDCVGKIPVARFGHTIIMISPSKVVLFGGAVGDTKNYTINNETYILNSMTRIWVKLESKIKLIKKTLEVILFLVQELLMQLVQMRMVRCLYLVVQLGVFD